MKEQRLEGSKDADLLEIAVAQGRVLLTHDRDFGDLALAQFQPIVGIVYLRPGHIEPAFTIESLTTLLGMGLDLTPPFIFVAQRTGPELRVRIRQLSA